MAPADTRNPMVLAVLTPLPATRQPSEMRKSRRSGLALKQTYQDFSFCSLRQTRVPDRPHREALVRRRGAPPSDVQQSNTAGPSWTGRTRFFSHTGSRAFAYFNNTDSNRYLSY